MKRPEGLLLQRVTPVSETKNDQTLAFEITPNTPTVRILASLSDGRTVIQDERGPTVRHTWARLDEWLKINRREQKLDINITCLRLQGPGGVDISMPPNQKGYFFGQKHTGIWGGPQANYVGIGYYDGQVVNVSWYKQPLFNGSYSEERTIVEAGFFLIQNP